MEELNVGTGKLTYGIKSILKTGEVLSNIKYDKFGVPTGIRTRVTAVKVELIVKT